MDATIEYEGRKVTFYGVDEKSHIGNCLLNVCWYELPNLIEIQKLNIRGNYVDAGSHYGTHALFFALFCPALRVYAFEPKRAWYELLLENIRRNHVTNCLPFNFALVEAHGATIPPDEGEEFATATLDSFRIPDVKVMKIDVENMELRVLKGATKTLKTVEHLFLEVWTDEVYARRGEASPMADICSFLEPYGLKFQKKLPWEDLVWFSR